MRSAHSRPPTRRRGEDVERPRAALGQGRAARGRALKKLTTPRTRMRLPGLRCATLLAALLLAACGGGGSGGSAGPAGTLQDATPWSAAAPGSVAALARAGAADRPSRSLGGGAPRRHDELRAGRAGLDRVARAAGRGAARPARRAHRPRAPALERERRPRSDHVPPEPARRAAARR